MEHNAKNWPYKWFGLWKEYGVGYEKYPSVMDFVNVSINSSYDKNKLKNYLSTGIIVASTSRQNFPSPFTGHRELGSISWRTDGEWMWLDNIHDFVEQNHLVIPESWYNAIARKEFIIPINIDEEQIGNLEWPSL